MEQTIHLTECPRDAMQGWAKFIPTDLKISYLNTLLKVGFEVLDFGSFVSPKAIPQLADTAQVLRGLELGNSRTKLLAIIANLRGAEAAVTFPEIHYLGFPFSISETFQLRNTNKTIAESLKQVEAIQDLCLKTGKKLLTYISMGFGNPYGDPYSPELAIEWFKKLAEHGIQHIALADTVGVAEPENIRNLFTALIPEFPEITIGAHFHSRPDTWEEKIAAAYAAGCRHFDTSLNGIGGCPMAEDELVGNIATEKVIAWGEQQQILPSLDRAAYQEALKQAAIVFS